jgi:hypothetical protein
MHPRLSKVMLHIQAAYAEPISQTIPRLDHKREERELGQLSHNRARQQRKQGKIGH